MGYKTKQEIMNRVAEHYEWAVNKFGNKRVVMVALQGSQNYGEGMSDENSDVDTKCMVLPSFEELLGFEKTPSFTKVFENEEHCDVKVHNEYFTLALKQNTNFLEMFFTEYYVVNPRYAEEVQRLRDMAESLARFDVPKHLSTLCGMAYQKQAALTKKFESKKELVEKFGFDGKQLAHLYRLREFMEHYLQGRQYRECLTLRSTPNMAEKMLNLKRHTQGMSVEEAEAEAQRLVTEMVTMRKDAEDKFLPPTKVHLYTWLKDFAVEMMTRYLRLDGGKDGL